jgi:glycosyltransferase involved in cell wall biosynthesis
LVESVTDFDAQGDLTAAIDLHSGLAKSCDSQLLWLETIPQKTQEQPGAIRLWSKGPGLPGELQDLFDNIRPDIVHTHRLDELAAIGQAAKQAGVPHIVHSVCGTLTGLGKLRLDRFAATVETLSPLLLAPSEEAADLLPASAHIEILPAGIDCERYIPGDRARARRKIGLPAGPRIIGCASPIQNLGTLLQALFRMDSEVQLSLFGAALPGKEERALIRRLGLEERVHVLGAWARPELIYQAIDVYFHGPAGDCLPRAVLAAQACGKPVIACAPTPNRALCPQTGRIAATGFMPTLLHSLRRSFESTDAATTRQFVLDNWNIGNTLERYGDLFKQLTARRQSTLLQV